VLDWEAFTVGDSHYLVAAQYFNTDSVKTATARTTSTRTDINSGVYSDGDITTSSAIYRWQGAEKFVPVHHIATPPSTDWETFTTTRGEAYLVCANGAAGVSQLFKVKLV